MNSETRSNSSCAIPARKGPVALSDGNSEPSGRARPRLLDWRRIPAVVSERLDSLTARARRIATDLNGFIRASRLDGAEVEILAAMADLRELRLMVRQLRAEAKAERRAA